MSKHAVHNIKHISYDHSDSVAEFMSEVTYDTLLKVVQKHVPSGSEVLDAGSGRGELLKRLVYTGYEAHGCDLDDRCVELGARYGQVTKLALEDISVHNVGGNFDCAVLSHVLEHVERPREILSKVAAVSNGPIVIAVPNPHYLPFVFKSLLRTEVDHVNTGHLYSWDWHHLKTFVEVGCSGRVLEWAYDSVALPAPHAVRKILLRAGILHSVECGVLRYILPRFCRSVIAVVQI